MADARKQLKEKICPVCGRRYIIRNHWAYKIVKDTHVTNYCSWTCMRKVEKGEARILNQTT